MTDTDTNQSCPSFIAFTLRYTNLIYSNIFYCIGFFLGGNIFGQKCIIIPLGCTLCHGTPQVVIYTPDLFGEQLFLFVNP